MVVAEGELAQRARLLNQPFRKDARTGRPWVLFKSAMTLDGKVATRSGDSKWISGEASRQRAHRWRGECDAVAVGIGTALADDPQLTARLDTVSRQPRRIVFDSLGRVPLEPNSSAPPGRPADHRRVARRPARGHRRSGHPRGRRDRRLGENEPARVRDALDQLGAGGITSILLEGGPHLAGAFLDAVEIDEIRLFLAPMLLGGAHRPRPAGGRRRGSISDAVRATDPDCERVGEDLFVSARLHEW